MELRTKNSLQMRSNKKQLEKEQPFAITANPSEAASHPEKLLNDIYHRIKCKSIEEKREVSNASESNIILLSYLSKSHQEGNETKESIQKLKDSLERANPTVAINPEPKPKKFKKFSEKQRIRTEFDDLDSVSEMEFLRRENEMLKSKLSKSEKRVIYLESFEGEVEYLKKLVLIQNTEIEKLRRAVKVTKREQLEFFDQENKLLQCASVGLKEVRGKKSPILISDDSQLVENEGKAGVKRKKCFHKLKEEGLNQHVRTESIADATSISKNRSFHSKSREQIRKSSCKQKKEKNMYR